MIMFPGTWVIPGSRCVSLLATLYNRSGREISRHEREHALHKLSGTYNGTYNILLDVMLAIALRNKWMDAINAT